MVTPFSPGGACTLSTTDSEISLRDSEAVAYCNQILQRERDVATKSASGTGGFNRYAGNTYSDVIVSDSGKAHVGDVYHLAPAVDEERAKQQCLRILYTVNYEQHKNFNSNRAKETCQWVIQHEQFQRWHTSTNNELLWLSADPGCGKSVFSKYLVDEWLPQNNYSNVCYFFFKDNADQSRLDKALSSLLYQLLSAHQQLIKSHILPEWKKMGKTIAQSTQKLWDLLLTATADKSIGGPVICILDALDECMEQGMRQLIEYLCKFVCEKANCVTHIPNIKFLVTSRPYDEVGKWFDKTIRRFPSIHLRGEDKNEQMNHEINMVIDQHLTDLADAFKLSAMTQSRLRTTLYGMENRTYLWLHLTIDHLRQTLHRALDPDEVRVDMLPRTVEDAYEQILQKVESAQKPRVQRIFKLVLGARRPLTIQEMAIALCILESKDERDLSPPSLQSRTRQLETSICQWCGLFVFLREGRIYLIHQTAKDFLISDGVHSTPSKKWKGYLVSQDCEIEMARVAVRYLRLRRFTVTENEHSTRTVAWLALRHIRRNATIPTTVLKTSGPEVSEVHSLYLYCARWWASHIEAGLQNRDDTELLHEATKLCLDTDMFTGWFRYRHRKEHWILKNSLCEKPQFMATAVGSLRVLQCLHEMGKFDPEARDFRHETALFWAVKAGNADLLGWVTDITLQWATMNASLLTNAAVNVYMVGTWALLNKHGPLPLRLKQKDGQTVLHQACQYGNMNMVKILLDHGANVNSRIDRKGTTALMIAAREGFTEIVKLLIQSADINKKDDHGHTALDYARFNNENAIIELLRSRGGRSGHDHIEGQDGTLLEEWEMIEAEDILDPTGEFCLVQTTQSVLLVREPQSDNG